jgi:hypothetical protein
MSVDLTPFTPTGPANSSIDETTGDRWYHFEQYGRLLSVTTAFRSIAKSGLVIWSAQLAAAAAFTELPTVISASRTKPCDKTTSQCRKTHDWNTTCERCPCGTCRLCVQKWLADRHMAESSRRADEGTRVHDVIEWWSFHGEYRGYDPDIAPYVEAFKAFVAEYGLAPDSFLMAEATVVNPADRYAGTTDGMLRFHAERTEAAAKLVARVLRARGDYGHLKTGKALVRAVIRDKRFVDLLVDWKTRERPLKDGESPKFYPENAMQLAGYRMAPIVRIKNTDRFVNMPDTDGALVVQLRPDGATPRLVVADDTTYGAFLAALKLYLWLSEAGSKAIGAYTFPLDLKSDAPVEPAIPEPERCPNCRSTLEDCNAGGCGQRREPGWRTTSKRNPFDLIAAATGPVDDSSIPF